MKIASIVLLSLFFLVFIGGILVSIIKKVDKTKYDLVTDAPLAYKVFGWSFTIIGLIPFLVGAIHTLVDGTSVVGSGLLITGFIIAFLGDILLFVVLVGFEAIKDHTIYIRTAFKIKQFDINKIASIDFNGLGSIVFDDEGNRLFSLDRNTKDFNLFLEEISKRSSKGISSNVDSFNKEPNLENPSESLTYETIGKEYRKNYPKIRKKRIVLAVSESIFLIGSVLSIFAIELPIPLVKRIILLVVTIALLVGFGIFILKRIIVGFDNELNLSDKSLGMKYKYSNKAVAGHHRVKAKHIRKKLLQISLIGIIPLISLPIAYSTKPYGEDELEKVNGVVDYFNYVKVEHSYYELGFVGDQIEYRIDETNLASIGNLESRIVRGKEAEILIRKNQEPQEINGINFKREKYTWFYTIVTSDDEILSYSMYFENEEKSSRSAIVWSYYLLGISLTSLTAALVVETTYGRKKEGEYITL